MNIPFLDKLLKRHPVRPDRPLAKAFEDDPVGVAALLSECELLRSQAASVGLELDDTPDSLVALDQLLPLWRDDPEALPWLGNDAGLYLGTVVVRTVPGACWHVWPGGSPAVLLPSGREIPVVEAGLDWAVQGVPELSQMYAEATEA